MPAKDADAFALTAGVDVRDGIHVPDRETITVSEAGKLWLKACAAAGLERSTLDQYGQHVTLHIDPFIGATKLNKLSVPTVRQFQEELRTVTYDTYGHLFPAIDETDALQAAESALLATASR